MPAARCLLCALLAFGPGCAAPPAAALKLESSLSAGGEQTLPALPDGWSSVDPYGFELLALAWPGDEVAPEAHLRAPDLEELRLALGGEEPDPGPVAVRAAVLLARSGDPRAIEVILARLEARCFGPERASDAGDVVAAAALASFEPAPLRAHDAPARLCALAVGEGAHPDLEVRVELAARALELGRDEPIPFLLAVLRAGTADEPWPDFERKQTLAWSKTRAAAALAARAATVDRFEADGSFADQRAQAARLAALLPKGP